MSSQIAFALVGCGQVARRHAEHAAAVGTLAAVCDIELDRAKGLGEPYGARVYSDLGEMLASEAEVDVLAVCTPNGLHAEHTIQALAAGKHVLCEKPMAISVHDCGEMIKAAERANRRLFVVKQNRFNPPIAALKRCLDEGLLGRVLGVQVNCFWNRNELYYESPWRGTMSLDGGILLTQFSHFVDLLYWLVGDVRDVRAFGGNFLHSTSVEFEDHGVAILDFYSGVVGSVHFTINSYGQNMEGSITLFAERGTVKVGGQYLNELEYQRIEDYEISGLPRGNPPNQYGQYQGSASNHRQVYDNVVEVLSNQGIIATSGFEGLKTVEIIDRIHRAMRRTRPEGC